MDAYHVYVTIIYTYAVTRAQHNKQYLIFYHSPANVSNNEIVIHYVQYFSSTFLIILFTLLIFKR